ncbi:cyclic AMP-responsive element-binding protein 1 isoform X3 [Carettochelys insculpta]|uniref:cyclic AMP-responsive element-binding protein 1 isoform X3 n=1 Tax=Carettochelys insculpta TaxID=44489 RepID=UPI003EBF3B6A
MGRQFKSMELFRQPSHQLFSLHRSRQFKYPLLQKVKIHRSQWIASQIHKNAERSFPDDPPTDAPGVPRIEEEKSEEETSAPAITTVTVPTPIYQTSSGQYIAITQGGAIQLANNGTDGVQGLQTLTMTNAAATQPGTTILQYAQTTDGQQILVPSNQVVVQAASGDVQTYQIRTAPTSTIAPGVVMASSPALPTQPAEEAARKREVRLMKNREAARECRRKKKEYVKCLENRVAVLENQNKTLIEELKALKDLYCHKSD